MWQKLQSDLSHQRSQTAGAHLIVAVKNLAFKA
jgi:hypothetical protein